MTVGKILAAKGRLVTTALPSDTVANVSAVLAEKKIGAVVVVGEDDSISGIVSERDIVRVIAAKGGDALSIPVSTIMTESVITCEDANTVDQVMGKMTDGRFRHMPVAQNGRLAGLISIGDIVKAKIAQIEADAEQLRSYIASA